MRVNLTNIEIAVFDFDDTLAVHKNTNYLEDRLKDRDRYYLEAYMYPNRFYKDIEPCVAPADLKLLIDHCKETGIKTFCISGMRYSLHRQAKEEFIHEQYGDNIEFVQTSSQKLKIDAIRVLLRANGLDWNNLLFVDDMEENVKEVIQLGGYAILPNEVNKIMINDIESLIK